MPFDLPTAARRSAALLAMIAIAGCDSTRTVEATAAPAARPAPSAAGPAFDATGTGSSDLSVNTVPLVNPSFETPGAGWTFNNVDNVNGWQASDGTHIIDLNAFSPGSVSQAFATIPGVTYTVTFDLAGNPGNPQDVKTMTVSAAGVSTDYSFDTRGFSTSNMGWTHQTFTFTATDASTTLAFTSTYSNPSNRTDNAQGAAIDNVRVTWVPTSTTTTVTFGSGPFIYNGTAFTATATASPPEAGTPAISYSGDCINPGNTCVAIATLAANGQYASSTAKADITIEKIPTTTTVAFASGPHVYSGTALTATASVSPAAAGSATIAYSGDCTNAGTTCTATASFAGNDLYAASTSAPVSIAIDKAPTSTSVAFASTSVDYNGSPFIATATVSPAAAGSATISYGGDCTNAGNTCTATASFAGSNNYLPSSSSTPASLVINKAKTTTAVSFGTASTVYYTGSAFTATASVSPSAAGTATIAYSGQCTFAGTCTATATYAGNGNYLSSGATTTITIKYPPVTSADQCKNGGWQYLTDDLGNLFKNQGDCVSYVATKGRNKGAGGV